MTLSTATAAVNITPVVFRTFFAHLRKKIRKGNFRDKGNTEATDDILFDEAFHIVKAFLELATRNTVDELQAFTNTYVPPPFWAECVACTVPLPCCNKAADILIDWFGPEQLQSVVGGEKWWQVRGLLGIQAEWIAMKRDWEKLQKAEKRVKRTNKGKSEMNMEYSQRLDELNKVIFYIHGGGFYFGSINTHRYQILRLARKLGGRAFAVNYRKSPQYPWPCPLQDVLAAYLYLIRPPPGSDHTPIDPKRLVLAGDSAGGNLCLSLLVILRDMGLPMPAGAVLISPWVDLTHSFPSIMENTTTDIIPPHGFVHKPSTLWPIPTTGPRTVPVTTADEAKLMVGREPTEPLPEEAQRALQEADLPGDSITLRNEKESPLSVPSDGTPKAHEPSSKELRETKVRSRGDEIIEPQKVQVVVERQLLEIRSQIQLYATNTQITHPLASPLLNSSLGGLCPLYIIAGNYEVLRDEIVYLAHRAADPARFPLREGLMGTPRQRENAEKFKVGTRVHFQLYDDMCHVLTVFSFTASANFAYRGIARFAKRVMEESDEQVGSDPFPATNLGPVFPSAELPVSETPSGVDEKQEPSASKGDHVGRERLERKVTEDDTIIVASAKGETRRPDSISILCERVDIHGQVRPLECDAELQALKLPPNEIGVIKDTPVKRWMDGQEMADTRWKKRCAKIERKKDDIEKAIAQKIEEKREKALQVVAAGDDATDTNREENGSDGEKVEQFVDDGFYTDGTRRWTPFDLEGETPSPSAIVGRRDTRDALALIETSFYRPPEPAHPKKPIAEPIILSPSEQQRVSKKTPRAHGVKLWSSLMSKFMKTNLKKAPGAEVGESGSDDA